MFQYMYTKNPGTGGGGYVLVHRHSSSTYIRGAPRNGTVWGCGWVLRVYV